MIVRIWRMIGGWFAAGRDMAEHVIETVEELRSSYGEPSERAVKKALDRLDRHCRRFIALSPFVVLASAGADGRVDCSPRGDPAGFVAILDDRTILLPDRRGNNRADSLTNVLENPHVGMLFMIPGVDETLRLNGRAKLTTDPAMLQPLSVNGRVPRSGLVVEVEEVFLQCTKALVRSRLWADETRVDRKTALPSFGQMLADHIGESDGEKVDREIRARVRETLY